jgi:hypothetical protein
MFHVWHVVTRMHCEKERCRVVFTDVWPYVYLAYVSNSVKMVIDIQIHPQDWTAPVRFARLFNFEIKASHSLPKRVVEASRDHRGF